MKKERSCSIFETSLQRILEVETKMMSLWTFPGTDHFEALPV